MHRTVREGLTNARRHAPGAEVTVAVTVTGEAVDVVVRNGPGDAPASAPGTGRGLDGVERRVASLGGRCEHAPNEDGGYALRAARHRPDVVLMDLRMPGTDGVSATARIREPPEPPVVVAMTTFDTDEHVLAALDAGASGFLLKTTPPDRLIPFVLAAAAGASVLSPEAVQRLRRSAVADPAPDPQVEALSPRERELLALLGEGRSNADIAARLYLSEGTVKGHVSRRMAVLDCENRTQLALRAVRQR